MSGEWYKVGATYLKEFYKRDNKIFIKIFFDKDKHYHYCVAPLSGFGYSDDPTYWIKSDKSLVKTKLEALIRAKEKGWDVDIIDHLKIAKRSW